MLDFGRVTCARARKIEKTRAEGIGLVCVVWEKPDSEDGCGCVRLFLIFDGGMSYQMPDSVQILIPNRGVIFGMIL